MTHRNGQAYSQNLRDRVFEAVDDGMPVYEVATLFRVSVSYVYRALTRRRMTGKTDVALGGGGVRPKLQDHEAAIRQRIAAIPDTTIEELRVWLAMEHGVSISYGATWSTLDRLMLTYKKSSFMLRNKTGRTSPDGSKTSRRRKARCHRAS